MDKLIDKLPDVLGKIPEILEKSGNLFSFFALLVLAIGLLSYFFYNQAERTEKNRAFVLILLFFFGLVLAALAAGVFSGFQKGSEAANAEIKKDPSLIKISPGTVQKLEGFISLKGQKPTEENKAQHLEKALEAYLNPSESSPAPQIFPSPSPSSSEVPSSQSQEVEGFLFESQGCKRTRETRIECSFLVTNNEKDREIYLASSTTMIDSTGIEYRSNAGIGFSDTGLQKRYLVQNVGVNFEIHFEEIPTEVGKLVLIEFYPFLFEPNGEMKVQFRNIPISS